MGVYDSVRVSSTDQNEDRQLSTVEEINIVINKIYINKQSGKDFNRPNYQKLIRKLRCGDTL